MSSSVKVTANFYSEVNEFVTTKDSGKVHSFDKLIETSISPLSSQRLSDSQDDSSSITSVSEESGMCCEFETSSEDSLLFESDHSFGDEEEPISMLTKPLPVVLRTLYTIPEEEICISEELQVYFDLEEEEVYAP